MLIRDDETTWTAITQPAHAHLAGQVARAWDPAPSADAILGVEQHDIAWSEWDRTPPLNAEAQRAAAFFEAPLEPRLDIWRGVSSRLDALNPYAALLVSLHATNIHTRYMPPEHQPHDLLDGAREDQDALLAVVPGATRQKAEKDADLLFACDALSLSLCNGWPERELPAVDGVVITLTPDGEDHVLDPWPLAVDVLELSVLARTFSERFTDEAAMHRALERQRYDRLRFRLKPRA